MQGSRQFPHGSLATNSRNPTSNQSINQWIDQEPPPMERCKDIGAVGWERAETQRNLIKPWTGLPCSLKSGKVDGR